MSSPHFDEMARSSTSRCPGGASSFFAIGVAAWLLLCGLWSMTLYRTLRGVASGVIFQPHP